MERYTNPDGSWTVTPQDLLEHALELMQMRCRFLTIHGKLRYHYDETQKYTPPEKPELEEIES